MLGGVRRALFGYACAKGKVVGGDGRICLKKCLVFDLLRSWIFVSRCVCFFCMMFMLMLNVDAPLLYS